PPPPNRRPPRRPQRSRPPQPRLRRRPPPPRRQQRPRPPPPRRPPSRAPPRRPPPRARRRRPPRRPPSNPDTLINPPSERGPTPGPRAFLVLRPSAFIFPPLALPPRQFHSSLFTLLTSERGSLSCLTSRCPCRRSSPSCRSASPCSACSAPLPRICG